MFMEKTKRFLWENRFFLAALALLLFLNLRFDFYYIKTGSMELTLPVGSIVVVDRNEKAQAGDIFAYQNGKNVVIHRIIAVDEEGYLFQGDANPSQDAAKVTREQLVGKVTAKIKLLVPWIRLLEKI